MVVHLSAGFYLFVATKKCELRLFNTLSKKLQSFEEVAATASLAIPAESPNSEATSLSITKHVPCNIWGFWHKTMGTSWYKNLFIRNILLSRSKEVAENQLDHLLTVVLARLSMCLFSKFIIFYGKSFTFWSERKRLDIVL